MSKGIRLLQEIRRAWKLEPFRPFQLRLVDGKTLPVRDPEQVRVWPPDVVYISPWTGMAFIHISQILAVEPILRRRPRKRRTGQARRLAELAVPSGP
jgi:hypothetical protein